MKPNMFQKGKDMKTMNRLYSVNNDILRKEQPDERGLGFILIYSSSDKHKRGNCVWDI